MRHDVTLRIMSLLSILLMTFHVSDDVVRGMEPGGMKNMFGILITVTWLYGTLVLSGRRSGYIVMLLGSLLGSLIPVVHMRGSGMVGGRIAGSEGVHFWVWTLLALGATAGLSLILAAWGLWSLRRRVSG